MIPFLIQIFTEIIIGFVIFQYFQSFKVRNNKENYATNNEYLRDEKRTDVTEMVKFISKYIQMTFKKN